VPAHIGIEGNEKADQLAKQATGWREQGQPKPPATPWVFTIRLVAALNREEKEISEARMGEAMENNQDRPDITGISTRNHKEDARNLQGAAKSSLSLTRSGEDWQDRA
jgi:hypothetical protein